MVETRLTISPDGLTGNIGKDWWKTRGRHIHLSARARDPHGDVAMMVCKMAAASFDWDKRPLPEGARKVNAAVQQLIYASETLARVPGENPPAPPGQAPPDVVAPVETAEATAPGLEGENPMPASSGDAESCESVTEPSKSEAETPPSTAPTTGDKGNGKTRRGKRTPEAKAEAKAKSKSKAKARRVAKAEATRVAKAKSETEAKPKVEATPGPPPASEAPDGSDDTPQAGH